MKYFNNYDPFFLYTYVCVSSVFIYFKRSIKKYISKFDYGIIMAEPMKMYEIMQWKPFKYSLILIEI